MSASTTMQSDAPRGARGTTFAGYVINSVAGRGGMGVVYRAREAFPERTVALKVISPELATDAEFRTRFVHESNLAATIEHPNVLPIFRAGEEAGLPYLAMRYVEGTDLAALIAGSGRLEPRRAVEIIVQVCAALEAAHRRGLVHRDVKPANVLLTRDDHVYLTDFGVAKRCGTTGGPTATGLFLGTLDYAAPEQIQSGHVDSRTDIYAAGCMLYHALTGRVPFPADGAAARIFAHLSTAAPSVRDVDTTLPAQLDDAIQRAMAKDPDDRYSSAYELGRAATLALRRESQTARVTPVSPRATVGTPNPRGTRVVPRRVLGAVASTAVVVALIAVVPRLPALVGKPNGSASQSGPAITSASNPPSQPSQGSSASTSVPSTAPPASAAAAPSLERFTGHDFSIDYPAGWAIAKNEERPAGTDNLISTRMRRTPESSDYLVAVDVSLGSATGAVVDENLAVLRNDASYQELAHRSISFTTRSGTYDATLLEFVLMHPDDGTVLHCVDVFFTPSPGRTFAILTRAPTLDYDNWAATLDRARSSLVVN